MVLFNDNEFEYPLFFGFCISKLEGMTYTTASFLKPASHIFLLIPQTSIPLGYTIQAYVSLSPVKEHNPTKTFLFPYLFHLLIFLPFPSTFSLEFMLLVSIVISQL